MQEATYWFNSAKWDEEKKEKATEAVAKAVAKAQSNRYRHKQEVNNEILTKRIETLEKAYHTLGREVTALQRTVYGKS